MEVIFSTTFFPSYFWYDGDGFGMMVWFQFLVLPRWSHSVEILKVKVTFDSEVTFSVMIQNYSRHRIQISMLYLSIKEILYFAL